MVLGSFQCRGVLLLWHIEGQGPAVLAAGAGPVGVFLAHLSRRLTCELIGKVGLRRPSSVVHPSSILFPSSPQKPFGQSIKFHMEPPWDGGTKVCSNDPG